MTGLSKKELDYLDTVLDAGSKGTHLWFTNSMIRDALENTFEKSRPELENHFLDNMVFLCNCWDLNTSKEYVVSLSNADRDYLIQMYLLLLENYMLSYWDGTLQ